MDYLEKYSINKSMIDKLKDTLDSQDILYLSMNEEKVLEILDYLLSIGVKNIYSIILYKSNIFYENPKTIKDSFMYNTDEIVKMINEDIAYFDKLGF